MRKWQTVRRAEDLKPAGPSRQIMSEEFNCIARKRQTSCRHLACAPPDPTRVGGLKTTVFAALHGGNYIARTMRRADRREESFATKNRIEVSTPEYRIVSCISRRGNGESAPLPRLRISRGIHCGHRDLKDYQYGAVQLRQTI